MSSTSPFAKDPLVSAAEARDINKLNPLEFTIRRLNHICGEKQCFDKLFRRLLIVVKFTRQPIFPLFINKPVPRNALIKLRHQLCTRKCGYTLQSQWCSLKAYQGKHLMARYVWKCPHGRVKPQGAKLKEYEGEKEQKVALTVLVETCKAWRARSATQLVPCRSTRFVLDSALRAFQI